MDKKDRIAPKAYIAIIAIGLLNSVVFSIPYIKTVFYDGMIEFTGSTNAQLGALMTIYGLGEVFSLPIGGLLAEKFDTKKVLSISTIATGVGCFALAASPSYLMTAIVWLGLIFTSLFMFWGALFKALRLLGSDAVQGKIMGFYSGAAGVGYFVVNMILLKVYDIYAVTSAGAGMQAVFVALGCMTVVVAILVYVAIKFAGQEEVFNIIDPKIEAPVQKVSLLQQMKIVAKYKIVWYFGGTLFCVYGMQIAIQYFTPYFTEVLGVTVVMSGVVAVLRTYGMQAIGAPVGGIIADKINSSAKVVIVCCLAATACLISVMLLPAKFATVFIVTAIVFIAAWFNGMSYGVQYALLSEGFVPKEYMASAIGFGSAIGFLPDVFQHTMFGFWMDKYGAAGYTYIFIYGCIVSVACVLLLFNFIKNKEKFAQKV